MRSATIMIPSKKKQATPPNHHTSSEATTSASPDNDIILSDREINYIRNQMSLLQSIGVDDPVYDITFKNVIHRLKTRPSFRTLELEQDASRLVWDVALTEDIHYRYELIEIGNEAILRCMFWAGGVFVEIMKLRLSPNRSPILRVHNVGYIPLSLVGAQFSHHFFAFEYFVRILYSLRSIWKRRGIFTAPRHIFLQNLPSNPLDIHVQVTIQVPSSDFGTETKHVGIGTLQDLLFAKPKYPSLQGGKRKPKHVK